MTATISTTQGRRGVVDAPVKQVAASDTGAAQAADKTRLGIAGLTAENVDFDEIALALCRTARFSGNGRHMISVGLHSVIVCDEAMRELCERREEFSDVRYLETSLAALLHDAHEAYVGDMVRPIQDYFAKNCENFMEARNRLTEELDRTIFAKAGISDLSPASLEIVAEADDRVGRIEAAVNGITECRDLAAADRNLFERIELETGLTTSECVSNFQAKFKSLQEALAKAKALEAETASPEAAAIATLGDSHLGSLAANRLQGEGGRT